MTPRRIVLTLLTLAIVWFAVQGGEYGTSDLLRQRGRERTLRSKVDSLHRVVDSLEAYRKAVQTEPALQERIAREEFGMVRGDRELLYRFTEDQRGGARDSAEAP